MQQLLRINNLCSWKPWILMVISVIGLGNGTWCLSDELSAGVSRIDLTPPLSLNVPLGGYGERMNRPAQGVRDRIFAKALCLSNGSRKFVIATADLLGFPPPFKTELLRTLEDIGIARDALILLPSHSHTSVEMNAFHSSNSFRIPQIGIFDPRIHQFLLEKFSRVIHDACAHLEPVRIGTSVRAIPGWNRNRRSQGGYTDDALTLTRIETVSQRPLAALVNFAAHPTFMNANHMEFSGDWPGHLQRSLEALIGNGVCVMYANGAEGDQAPVAPANSGNSPWERSEQYGRGVAVLAKEVWDRTPTERNLPFAFHRQEIPLPPTQWHPQFQETGGREYGLTEELLRDMLPRMFSSTTASVSLRLGDLLLIGTPGEMTAELGRQVKQSASQTTQARCPVIGGLADEWDSYILSPEEYRKGGYEASISFYGESLGPTIVQGMLQGVQKLPVVPTSAVSAQSSPTQTSDTMRVAVVQMRSTKNLAENVKRTQTRLVEAAKRGARVIVFPECSLSGYFDNQFMQSLKAEDLSQAERAIQSTCRELQVYAILGTASREGGKLLNSALVIDPSGKILERYHKLQLAESWCEQGDHLSVFPIDGTLCSIIVCHDERYPELVRLPVLAGSRVVFYISHESGIRQEKKQGPYRAQIQARAVENSVFVVHANAPANSDLSGSHGQSRVIDPEGTILHEASIFDEDLFLQTLELKRSTGRLAQLSVSRGVLGKWYQAGLQAVRRISP